MAFIWKLLGEISSDGMNMYVRQVFLYQKYGSQMLMRM